MLIDLSKVLSEPHRSIHEVVSCNLEDIRTRNGKFTIISKEDVTVDVHYLQKRQLEIIGKTALELEIPCDRCLEPVATKLNLDFVKKHILLIIQMKLLYYYTNLYLVIKFQYFLVQTQ